ncbi:ketopantoate reductase family protein [Marinobacter salinisoli]|uniref:2-dehydropantoate 2-reductase n=1 Tax=Marinobacter salinisoli TaxID=2769486 RepID=A0ABX7MPJ8_9GAMM|nr:ketopantoate reductase family protein [Marinobacter salinisoli]QSP94216.1 ketopantoate reductase family protein [Marinobacter salinisoli]
MIAILGAGAMGRLWAASLPAHETAFVPRPGQTNTAPAHFHFQEADGHSRQVTVSWLSAADSPALVLITTKAGDSTEAVEHLADWLPATTPIVLFQNGLGSQQAVAERWPDRPVLAATTTEGANRPAPDQLVHAGTGDTWIGPLTKPAEQNLYGVIARLSASGLSIHAEQDILGRLWQKLIINAGINPFTALLNCRNGDILSADLYRAHIDGLCQEIAGLMDTIGRGPADAKDLRQSIEAVARGTAQNISSMRSDVLSGKRTEIDYINGYIVRLGQSLNIATPVNRMLTEQVQQLSSG